MEIHRDGLFDNVEMNMIEFAQGDVLRFKTTGYEIADVRNKSPAKEWTGVVSGRADHTHIPLWCERENREATTIWVAHENIINNDTLGVPHRTR